MSSPTLQAVVQEIKNRKSTAGANDISKQNCTREVVERDGVGSDVVAAMAVVDVVVVVIVILVATSVVARVVFFVVVVLVLCDSGHV
jgi:hypothetical protein